MPDSFQQGIARLVRALQAGVDRIGELQGEQDARNILTERFMVAETPWTSIEAMVAAIGGDAPPQSTWDALKAGELDAVIAQHTKWPSFHAMGEAALAQRAQERFEGTH